MLTLSDCFLLIGLVLWLSATVNGIGRGIIDALATLARGINSKETIWGWCPDSELVESVTAILLVFGSVAYKLIAWIVLSWPEIQGWYQARILGG